jgi:hypothetical protein
MPEIASEIKRRVLLLETDERPGLVAAVAACCAQNGVSLEITTGPGHILVTFEASDPTVVSLQKALEEVAGVTKAHPYQVVAK